MWGVVLPIVCVVLIHVVCDYVNKRCKFKHFICNSTLFLSPNFNIPPSFAPFLHEYTVYGRIGHADCYYQRHGEAPLSNGS